MRRHDRIVAAETHVKSPGATVMRMSSISPAPGLPWRMFVVTGVATMTAVSLDDRAWDAFDDATGGTVSRNVVSATLIGTGAIHAAEAIVVYRSARKAQLRRPAWWAFSAFLWGFPVMRRLRKARRTD